MNVVLIIKKSCFFLGGRCGGGILLNPGGHVELTFAWGLGIRSNNESKWLALIQSLHILKVKKIRKALIIGDSRHVIYKLINGYITGAVNFRRLYGKAMLLMSSNYEAYHILCHNNSAADSLANVGASFSQGQYSQDGNHPTPKFIP